jgi:RNA polymerase sigma factor (sigma-70 family)
MSGDRTTELQRLLDLLRQGDEVAGRELVGRAYERLRFLAKRILHRDFPRFEGRHGTDSVLHAAAVRLLESLQKVRPATCRDFFNFAATQIRRVLLDAARRESLRAGEVSLGSLAGEDGGPAEPADPTADPAELAVWTEFHRKVELLPPAEREVVDLHWYHGLTQAEAAEVLGISPRMVSHHWVRARLELADWVPGFRDLLRERGTGHAE